MLLSFPFLRPQVRQRLPVPIDERESVALELSGFPEFVSDISPARLKAIDALAIEIIKSQETKDPIFEFRTEGHADIARTIPAGERRQFEQEISQERADNAFRLLVDAINRLGSAPLAMKIARTSRAFGLGSRFLKEPNAFNEEGFRRNRRVVFIKRQVTFLPAPPEPPAPPSSVIEERFSVRLVKTGNLSVSFLHALESMTLTATLEITDLIDKKRANFVVLATGVGIAGGPTKLGGSITFAPGPPVKFKIFRLLGPGKPTINLKSFEGRVTVFVSFGAGVGPASNGGVLSFSFDALESSGANTQPTVITLPSGNGSLTVPSLSAGEILPLGGMTMNGQPFDL